MPTSGGDQKATIRNLDARSDPGASLQVQFNPARLQLSDSARWTPQNNTTRPSLSYGSGNPATLRVELTFDATRGGGDVEVDHVAPLRALMEADERAGSGGAAANRPPYVQFSWSTFSFVGVVSQLDVQYTMFRPDGTPVRAKVNLTLLEHAGDDVAASSTASPATAASPRVVEVGPGQTVPAVAAQQGVSTADLARANGIDDPLAVEPGTPLVVPKSSKMADALERSARSKAPAAWGGVDPEASLADNAAGVLHQGTAAAAIRDVGGAAAEKAGLGSGVGRDAALLGDQGAVNALHGHDPLDGLP